MSRVHAHAAHAFQHAIKFLRADVFVQRVRAPAVGNRQSRAPRFSLPVRSRIIRVRGCFITQILAKVSIRTEVLLRLTR